MGADDRRRPDVRGGPAPLHRGDQRGRPRCQGCRRDRDRRHGLPRRGRRVELQLADPGAARSGVRVRRPGALDRVHRVPRAGLRRGALRRHARDGRSRARRHEPHRLRAALAQPVLQRHARRRDGDQRRALRHLELPRAARHRRPGRLRRGDRAARDGADHGRRQARPRPLLGSSDRAATGARADRGRCPPGTRRPEGGRPVRSGPTVRDPRRADRHERHRPVPARSRASRSSTRARSSPGPTTGGRPGGSSSSTRSPAAAARPRRRARPRSRDDLVAALGDGVTAGSPGFDPSHGNAKLLGFAEDEQSQWEYWAAQKGQRPHVPELRRLRRAHRPDREAARRVREGRRRPRDRGRARRHRAGPAGRRGGAQPAGDGRPRQEARRRASSSPR